MTVDKVQLGVPYTDTKPAQPYGYEHPRFVIVLRKIGDKSLAAVGKCQVFGVRTMVSK